MSQSSRLSIVASLMSFVLVGCAASMQSDSGSKFDKRNTAAFNLNATTRVASDYLSRIKLSCRGGKAGKCNQREQTVGLLFIEKSQQADGSKNVERCTGTLIAPAHVLTAGHCVHKVKASAINFILPNQKVVRKVVSIKQKYTDVNANTAEAFEGYPDEAILELGESVKDVKPADVDQTGFELPSTAVAIVINLQALDLDWETVTTKQADLEYSVDSIDCRVNKDAFYSEKDSAGRILPVLGLYGCPTYSGNSGGALFANKSQSDGFRLAGLITKSGIAGIPVENNADPLFRFNAHKTQLKDYMSRQRGKGFLENFEGRTSQIKQFFMTSARRLSCIDLSSVGFKSVDCQSVGYGHIKEKKLLAWENEASSSVQKIFERQYDKMNNSGDRALQKNLLWEMKTDFKAQVSVLSEDGYEFVNKDLIAVMPTPVCHKVSLEGSHVQQAFKGGAASRLTNNVAFYEISYGAWNKLILSEGLLSITAIVHHDFQGSANGTVSAWSMPYASPEFASFERLSLLSQESRTLNACDVNSQANDGQEIKTLLNKI